jgi:hypothetical protein
MIRLFFLIASTIASLSIAAGALAANPSAPLSVQVVPPPPPPGAAMRAYDFYSKWGTGIYSLDGAPNILAGLKLTHLNRIRIDTYTDFSTIAALAKAGVKLHVMFTYYNLPPLSVSSWLAGLKNNVVLPYPGAVLSVSGPNEVNLVPGTFCYPDTNQCGVAAANAAQHDLYTGIHADPAFAGIKVNMWPLGLPWVAANRATVGDQTANCDQAEIHDYYGVDDINQTFGQATGSQAVDTYFGFARANCNRPMVVTSEDGFCTPPANSCSGQAANNLYTTEYTAARVALNTMIDHAKRADNTGIYYFTLCCGDGWYAMLRDYSTPKLQGAAIANFLAIINDSGPNAATFPAGSLNYTLAGMPAQSENFLIQESSGAFMIILENHRSIWNYNNNTQISVPTSTVTVTFPRAMSGGVYDATQGTSPISTFSNVTSIQVGLNDAPLIVQAR